MSVEQILKNFLDRSESLPYPIHEAAFLAPETITFCQEVRDACKANMCGMYGRCWTCPPGVGSWQELRDHYLGYSHAFVFTTRHELEDSFDFEGMQKGREDHTGTERAIEAELLRQDEAFEICGAEGCTLCKQCSYPDAPCRHPDRIHLSMEATGMNVVKLAADVGIHYINGANTVTFFSVVFW
ncbi:MAG: DUF2284 domain-containing protein [Firmicutes bacterium]|nr:DUF2284 domain-containing protein [Bacillota bacterium]